MRSRHPPNKPINSVEDSDALQNDLDAILEWITSRGLVPNHNKTKLNITAPNDRSPPNSTSKDSISILLSPFAKLTWSEHISKSAKREIGLIHLIHRSKRPFPTKLNIEGLDQYPPQSLCQISRSYSVSQTDVVGAYKQVSKEGNWPDSPVALPSPARGAP